MEKCLEEWDTSNLQPIEKLPSSHNSYRDYDEHCDNGNGNDNSIVMNDISNNYHYKYGYGLIQNQKRKWRMRMRKEEEETWNQRRRREKSIINTNRKTLDEIIQLRTKLLFTFLEIYTLGMTSMKVTNHSYSFHPTTIPIAASHSLFQIQEMEYVKHTNIGKMTWSSSYRLQALFRAHREFLR